MRPSFYSGLPRLSSLCGGAQNTGRKELSVKPACEGSGGEITSENDDMSSDKECEKHSRRKSKGSCLKLI